MISPIDLIPGWNADTIDVLDFLVIVRCTISGLFFPDEEEPLCFPDHIPQDCRDFIYWALGFKLDHPSPSIDRIKAHPWMEGICWESIARAGDLGPFVPSRLLTLPDSPPDLEA